MSNGITESRAGNKVKGDEGKRPRKRLDPAGPPRPALTSARYVFFGGKGGVGKTTASCATALYLLDRARGGEHVLLFSTDPAHSLSDSLSLEVGDDPVEVASRGRSRLFACEMNAEAALAEFREKHRKMLGLIAEHGTLLDESDIDDLLSLSLPGLDEMMALFKLSEPDFEAAFARVVVDTAPSGHTWRLLQLPDVLARWVAALDQMEEKHRYMVAHLVGGGRGRESEVDLFLRGMRERIERARAMLYGGDSAFVLVTLAEGMAVEETARYLDALRRRRAPVGHVVINRVERERKDCPYCRARAATQRPWLGQIERAFKGVDLRKVPLLSGEVRGPKLLRQFARMMWEGAEDPAPESPNIRSTKKGAARGAVARVSHPRRANSIARNDEGPDRSGGGFDLPPLRLLIFGGKGGVGKTSAAAAAALALAEAGGRDRVLVFSIDPAHSLSDSFAEPVGELKRGVAGRANLDAMEIDANGRFEQFRERFRARIDEALASLDAGSRWSVQFDREAMRELVSLAPPGIDEIVAMGAISDLLDEGAYATIVLDTAPTGHLVRFLELPDLALSWVHSLMKLLLKYKDVVNWSSMAEELIALSKSIKRVAALLTSPGECEFVGVAIPEKMSLRESVRLVESLKRLNVPVRRLLINMVVPEEAASGCDFCAARRQGQENAISDFRKAFEAEVRLFAAPERPRELRGAERLLDHFARWRPLGK